MLVRAPKTKKVRQRSRQIEQPQWYPNYGTSQFERPTGFPGAASGLYQEAGSETHPYFKGLGAIDTNKLLLYAGAVLVIYYFFLRKK